MKTEALLPIAGILLGWFLNETSQRFGKKKEEKKSLSKAIAELLEIRHSMLGIIAAINVFKQKFDIPNEIWSIIRPLIYNFAFQNKLIDKDVISTRYNSAVDSICELDPLLGFRLRNKDILSSMINIFDTIADQDDVEEHTLYEVRELIISSFAPLLEETIISLAKKYSFFTSLRIRGYLKKPLVELDPSFESFLTEYASLTGINNGSKSDDNLAG